MLPALGEAYAAGEVEEPPGMTASKQDVEEPGLRDKYGEPVNGDVCEIEELRRKDSWCCDRLRGASPGAVVTRDVA
jgi:hypothetical protein